MSIFDVMHNPKLSVEAKTLFLILFADRDPHEEVPDLCWWTQRTTEDVLYELTCCDAFGWYKKVLK